jgi:hypothetical protein
LGSTRRRREVRKAASSERDVAFSDSAIIRACISDYTG